MAAYLVNYGEDGIMKNFKEMMSQLERIYALYLHGYGTRRLIEKAERFVFSNVQNVGLMF